MPYALRDHLGRIISLHSAPEPGCESLDAGHPDVMAFLGRDPAADRFASLDASLVRVLEDLVDALLRNHVINVTDLPDEAQAKLFERKHFRDGMRTHALSLFADGGVQAGSNDMVPVDWGSVASGEPPQAADLS